MTRRHRAPAFEALESRNLLSTVYPDGFVGPMPTDPTGCRRRLQLTPPRQPAPR